MDELMFQVIYANEDVHAFLLQFYHDEITDPAFQEELARETAWNHNERWNLSRHMAEWLPFEKNYKKVLQKIYELAGADME